MHNIKRFFIFGEEWLYYKVYCGTYSADRALRGEIKILVAELLERKLIDHWFFIRYNDPDPHLRLRFHLIDTAVLQKVIQAINFHFNTLLLSNTIYEVSIAVYHRETERYGENTIAEAEQLFYHNSQRILDFICTVSLEHDETARLFASLHMIAEVLNQFEVPLTSSHEFVQNMFLEHKSQYNIERTQKRKMSDIYLMHKKDIILLLTEGKDPIYLAGLHELVKCKAEEIKTIKIILQKQEQEQNVAILELIASFIHMNINRMFRTKQREYEFLCYDIMNRYYQHAINKK
ncbi:MULTISPECIES: thiopeptide-type bacteriocin biosynthesis protein [unclassified Flavobacterium]|uniref:thiopeptide-type bacteriocin biosynthesis protein n=1 Tax=unclassified Flavobacterium TaxID=196869 RepID=UPI0012B77B9E|nr:MULTISPECIES: thiopeptide-type bacteriocin biosynthesis protein [unclassified Flavobacterium]MTD71646.1 hypothetical protein [Flavobacterium sp. LC2016-13]